nr:MAG: polyprotein P2ab [Sobemovirus sp.]
MDLILMFTTIAAMLSTSALGLGWTKASNQWERTALIAVLLPTACVSTLALIVLLGWRMVSLWLVKATPAEYDDDTMAHIIGCRLDPEKGVVMDLLWNTERCSAVVNPCYWQFLPSDAISSPDGNESLVIGSKLSKIAPGKEPPSLVCISDGSRIVGMGSRVSYRGNSYLLTAAHVWMGKAEKLFLVKGALQVEVEVAKFPPKLGCLDAAADFVLVEIPSPCWARLRVKSSQLGGMDRPKLVTVFGGKNPQGLISSVGMANVGPFSHQIIHTATTVEGWSGTPLYSKGSIVGIHLGRRTLGKENRGVNVDLLLGIEDESDYSEGGNFTEIEREAAFDRDYDFVEIRMIGSGKIAVGHGEWVRSDPDAFEKKKKAKGEVMWGDIESDDEFYNTMEAPEDHLNLRAGGVAKALAALISYGGYDWCAPCCDSCLSTSCSCKGMPLWRVGVSACRFREPRGKIDLTRVDAAAGRFPELNGFAWPNRGATAENTSLKLQASRFRATTAPKGLLEACRALNTKYPKSNPRKCFQGETWRKLAVAEEAEKICHSEVNRDASPGVPLARLSMKNGQLLDQHAGLVAVAATERVWQLLEWGERIEDLSPRQLVQHGLCDPVRLFVKMEPHSIRKVEEGRFRLISSISIVDQIVERLIFGPQNQLEITRWRSIPSKPGMGLSQRDQAKCIWDELNKFHSRASACEADISGFDWSVQDWELWADWFMRCELGRFGEKLKRLSRARVYCLMNSTFQLSNGVLLEQQLPGLMKSGSYCTSSSNSRIRNLMAELIGAEWCIAMGDDSVEAYVEDAALKYYALGHSCKDYIPCAVESDGALKSVNFCSHEIDRNRFWLTSWPKTLYRYLCSQHCDFDDLSAELSSCPKWPQIRRYLVGEGSNENDEKEKNEQSELHAALGLEFSSPTPSAPFWSEPADAESADFSSHGCPGFDWGSNW